VVFIIVELISDGSFSEVPSPITKFDVGTYFLLGFSIFSENNKYLLHLFIGLYYGIDVYESL